MGSRRDEVLFRTPARKLWKARALPFSIWLASMGFGIFAAYLLLAGDVGLEGFAYLILISVGGGHIGYFGTFGRNRLAITTTHVAPPGKPLSRLGLRELTIPWREVTSIEETQRLYTGPDGVNYALALHTEDGRRYPFKALYVAWQTESTAEMRRVYEMMKAIAEALERGPLDRLDEDPALMARLKEIQTAEYPELDLFSRTPASKLAMAAGGSAWLVGLILVLLPLEGQTAIEALSRVLWIVGGLIFLLGLSTKRAFASWKRRSSPSRSLRQ